ncbi:hypothetical protein [Methanoregula sp. UBA64]|uniref:hypothetical protein n=1 Tax=Methanoregula sp. UBA64 TaxID=1915554 RepID=UPI0025DA3CDF|nr:hypothetical protein [Methanoregula sp. UBA64]
MQRMRCPGCGKDYDVMAGCSCCQPSPGPFRCPACGAELVPSGPAYYFSGSYDEE